MKDQHRKLLELLDADGPCLHALLVRQVPDLQARYNQSLRDAYRLTDEQVLALIPPALAGPRIELEQAQEEIRRLVDEQVREREAPLRRLSDGQTAGGRGDSSEDDRSSLDSQSFTWDNGIDLRAGRPIFRDGASLEGALGRIAEVSRFEYEIAPDLMDLRIPGDWVLRKGSPRESRVAALERIVRDSTGRPVAFHKVIVARGTFRLTPLSGTNPVTPAGLPTTRTVRSDCGWSWTTSPARRG